VGDIAISTCGAIRTPWPLRQAVIHMWQYARQTGRIPIGHGLHVCLPENLSALGFLICLSGWVFSVSTGEKQPVRVGVFRQHRGKTARCLDLQAAVPLLLHSRHSLGRSFFGRSGAVDQSVHQHVSTYTSMAVGRALCPSRLSLWQEKTRKHLEPKTVLHRSSRRIPFAVPSCRDCFVCGERHKAWILTKFESLAN